MNRTTSDVLHAPAEGGTITRHLEGSIVETSYHGKIVFDGALYKQLETMLWRYPGMDWLVDASGATGIDPSRRDNAGNVIDLFRNCGGGAIACVIPSSAIRMIASAIAFGFDLKLAIFSTRAEALAHLRARAR